jgi:hypothetical protein
MDPQPDAPDDTSPPLTTAAFCCLMGWGWYAPKVA